MSPGSYIDMPCVDCKFTLAVPLPVSEPVMCTRCKKSRFANEVLSELEHVESNGNSYEEAHAMFHDKVKELAEHYQLGGWT